MKNQIIAILCEGAAEHAILDILLENDLLIFEKNKLLDEKILRIRSAKKFEQTYLRKNFDGKIEIYRFLDSRSENFKISKEYKEKVSVTNVITAPEIEILIIHSENKYAEFIKSRKKPSIFCKENLKFSSVKSYDFVKEYFSTQGKLVAAIESYRSKKKFKKGETSISDFIAKKN